jgi:hypothetical protein
MDRETEAIMASKKPTARKTTKSTLKQKLVAMEKALEKGAADLGRRVKKEMPAVKARVAKAGKRVSQTAVAVEEELKNDVAAQACRQEDSGQARRDQEKSGAKEKGGEQE